MLQLENQTEKEVRNLVQSLREGDSNAFDKLFAVYGGRLFGFVYGYLKVKEEAEDVVQDAFLCVWRAKKNLNPDLSFKSYLFKIAYHRILEHFEYVTRQQKYVHQILEDSVEFTDDMDDRLNYQMLLDKVELCIEQLPSRQKEVLIKKRKEGFSVKEISVQLSISPKTVENHLSEALKKLKKELGLKSISNILMFVFAYKR